MDGSCTQFKLADPSFDLYLLVIDASTIKEAYAQALAVVGFDPALLTGGAAMTVGHWQAYSQEDSAGLSYGLAGQIMGENAYVFMIKAHKPGINPENPVIYSQNIFSEWIKLGYNLVSQGLNLCNIRACEL